MLPRLTSLALGSSTELLLSKRSVPARSSSDFPSLLPHLIP